MSKHDLIDAIRQVNRTAAPEFLEAFKEIDLKRYLERICAVSHRWRSSLKATVDGNEQLVMN